jgi:hypothetical protein
MKKHTFKVSVLAVAACASGVYGQPRPLENAFEDLHQEGVHQTVAPPQVEVAIVPEAAVAAQEFVDPVLLNPIQDGWAAELTPVWNPQVETPSHESFDIEAVFPGDAAPKQASGVSIPQVRVTTSDNEVLDPEEAVRQSPSLDANESGTESLGEGQPDVPQAEGTCELPSEHCQQSAVLTQKLKELKSIEDLAVGKVPEVVASAEDDLILPVPGSEVLNLPLETITEDVEGKPENTQAPLIPVADEDLFKLTIPGGDEQDGKQAASAGFGNQEPEASQAPVTGELPAEGENGKLADESRNGAPQNVAENSTDEVHSAGQITATEGGTPQPNASGVQGNQTSQQAAPTITDGAQATQSLVQRGVQWLLGALCCLRARGAATSS